MMTISPGSTEAAWRTKRRRHHSDRRMPCLWMLEIRSPTSLSCFEWAWAMTRKLFFCHTPALPPFYSNSTILFWCLVAFYLAISVDTKLSTLFLPLPVTKILLAPHARLTVVSSMSFSQKLTAEITGFSDWDCQPDHDTNGSVCLWVPREEDDGVIEPYQWFADRQRHGRDYRP